MIQAIKNLFRKRRKFLDVLSEFYDKIAVEQSLEQATQNRHQWNIRRIRQYFAVAGIEEITIDKVRVRHVEDLRLWLKQNSRAKSLTWVSRHVEMCKRAMKYAVLMEYCSFDVLGPIKRQRDRMKDVIPLTIDELRRIAHFQFQSEPLRKAADMFIFQAFTGISYSDLIEFRIERRDGKDWIYGKRRKTKSAYTVPLFEPARRILRKYNGELPKVVNSYYNRLLGEVAGIVGIEKPLHSHVGRKCFATLLNERGASLRTISQMLGNTDAVCDRHYIGKSTARIENELARLNLTLDNLLDQPVELRQVV